MYDGNDPYSENPDYEAEHADYDGGAQSGPEILSTSQAINLTSTVAALSALAALFLCFADQRSRAVRHFSVQSVGLGVFHLGSFFVCLLLMTLLAWIPIIGPIVSVLLWLAFVVVTAVVFLLRVRMMLRAYRGENYSLPVAGESLRRFE